MIVHTFALVLLAAGLSATAQLTESSPLPVAVAHLRVTNPAAPQPIPDSLFGSFLEPIGHSTYGGLWADVVENPSFEPELWSVANVEGMLRAKPELRRASELGLPLPWEPLDSRQGNRYLSVRGDAGNSFQSLLLMGLPGKEVGVLQEVYLPVARQLNYAGSVMVKHLDGPAGITISLRRRADRAQVLATTKLDAGTAAWTKYAFTLTLAAGTVTPLEPLDLAISVAGETRAQIDNISLQSSDAVDGMDPEVIAMARDLNSPLIRFGGNYTSAYHWRDGIGPSDKRVSMSNASWGIPEYNTFGTDEFLRFCALIHAEPQIALNLGTGTPAEAAEWVRYVDAHWNAGKGGLLWEMGNELWGDFQIGYPSQDRIAASTLAVSRRVREADPHARLIATGGDEDFFTGWNKEQLSNPKGTFDLLSTHFVVNDRVQLPNASNDFRSMAALALPWGLAAKMHAIAQQARDAGQPDVRVAFTEWLMISDSHTGPHFTNLGGALFAGGFLNMVMRNADVVSVSDMTGILEFGGIWKKRGQVYGAPAYWVLREYARRHPRWLLDVHSDGPTYTIAHGVTRLPEIADIPYLDCAASQPADRSSLILTCVNRHLTRPQAAEIDLRALGRTVGPLTVTTIAGENLLVENDELETRRVAPVTTTEAVPSGNLIRRTFPNLSVTVLEIGLNK